jgi:hypothetical protein
MACNTITSFELNSCEANLGGIKNVWLADYKEDAAIMKKNDKEEDESVSGFTEDITWIHFPMRKNVASMTSTLTTSTEGGVFITTELSMVFSKMETAKRMAVMALALGEAMAIVEDSNGKLWFLGKDAPLTATAGTGETGTAKADRNAYTVTLTDESLEMPYEVAKDLKPTI